MPSNTDSKENGLIRFLHTSGSLVYSFHTWIQWKKCRASQGCPLFMSKWSSMKSRHQVVSNRFLLLYLQELRIEVPAMDSCPPVVCTRMTLTSVLHIASFGDLWFSIHRGECQCSSGPCWTECSLPPLRIIIHGVMTRIHSEKWVARRFCPCVTITKCTYTSLHCVAQSLDLVSLGSQVMW
jgi:hypothetical protein